MNQTKQTNHAEVMALGEESSPLQNNLETKFVGDHVSNPGNRAQTNPSSDMQVVDDDETYKEKEKKKNEKKETTDDNTKGHGTINTFVDAKELLDVAMGRAQAKMLTISGYIAGENDNIGRAPRMSNFGNLKDLVFSMPSVMSKNNLRRDENQSGTAYTAFYRFSDGNIPKIETHKYLEEKRYQVFYMRTESRGSVTTTGNTVYYPVMFDPQILEALADESGKERLVRSFSSNFKGRDYATTLQLMRQQLDSAVAGQNHVAYIFSMLRYYYSAVTKVATEGEVAGSFELSTIPMVVAQEASDWVMIPQDNRKVIVRHDAGDYDYKHFLGTCCSSGRTKYYCHDGEDLGLVTPWDMIPIKLTRQYLLASKDDTVIARYMPTWPGNPDRILNYIATYVGTLGLEQEANIANRFALMVPLLVKYNAMLELPEPCHITDYIRWQVRPDRPHKFELNDSSTIRPFEKLYGSYLTYHLVEESLGSWAEGMLADRNDKGVSAIELKILKSLLHYDAQTQGWRLGSLTTIMSGYDFEFCGHANITELLLRMINYFSRHVKVDTLYKLFLATVPQNSHAHWIRRETLVDSTVLKNGMYSLTKEQHYILKQMRFEEEDNDITNMWKTHPFVDRTRSYLVPHNNKIQWLQSLQGVKARLYLAYIQWESKREDILNVEEDEDEDFSMIAQMSNATMPRMPLQDSEAKRRETRSMVSIIKDDSTKAGAIHEALKHTSVPKRMTQEEIDLELENERRNKRRQASERFWRISVEIDNKAESMWYDLERIGRSSMSSEKPWNAGPLSIMETFIKKETWKNFYSPVLINSLVERTLGVKIKEEEPYTLSELIGACVGFNQGMVVRYSDENGQYRYHGLFLEREETLYLSKEYEGCWQAYIKYKKEKKHDDEESITVGIKDEGMNLEGKSPSKAKGVIKSIFEHKKRSQSQVKGKEVDNDTIEQKGDQERLGDKTYAKVLYRSLYDIDLKKIQSSANMRRMKVLRDLGVTTRASQNWLIRLLKLKDKIGKKVNRTFNDHEMAQYLQNRYFGAREYNYIEVAQLLDNSGSEVIEGITSIVPRWVWQYHQIYNISKTWKEIKELYRLGQIEKDFVVLWHMFLFPFQPIAKWLKISETLETATIGCGCTGCTIQKVQWRCPSSKEGTCGWNGISVSKKKENEEEYPQIHKILPSELGQRFTKERAKKLNAAYPFELGIGQRKTNLDLATLVWEMYNNSKMCKIKYRLIRDILNRQAGTRNHLMTAKVLYILGNTLSPQGSVVLNETGFFGCCENHWLTHMKEVHEEIRSERAYNGWSLTNKDHSNLMYLDLLYGRLGKEVDWQEEEEKRTRKRVFFKAWDGEKWSEDFGKERIKVNIDKIINQLKPVGKLETLEEYWNRRVEWVPSGAATGKGKTLDANEAMAATGTHVTMSEIRGTKRSYMERLTSKQLRAYLVQKPMQKAFAHTKGNELAKTRAIFGVEAEHYFLHNFICSKIEVGLKDKEIQIKEAPYQEWNDMLERQRWCEEGRVLNSFDFSDFNDQHELWTMEYLHEKFVAWYKRSYPNDEGLKDIIEVGDWIAKSFQNSIYIDKREKVVQLSGGMYSGNRATTLINTLLNKVYLEVVNESCAKIYHSKPTQQSFRTGDDVVSVMKNEEEGRIFNSLAIKHNIVANSYKQILDYGYMEYLRLMYYENGEVLGSLCRAIGTFVNGNWESEVADDSIQRANAIWDQCALLMRRGLDKNIANLILENSIKYNTRIIHREHRTQPLTMQFLKLSTKNGGLGLPKLGEIDTGVTYSKHKIETNVKVRRYKFKVPPEKNKATRSYLQHINEKVLPKWAKIEPKDLERAREAVMQTTLGSELPRKTKLLSASHNEIKAINNSAVEATKERNTIKRIDIRPKGTVKGAQRIAEQLSKTLQEYRRTQKYISILPYVTCDKGKTKQQLELNLYKTEQKDLSRLTSRIDRLDAGWVPPHLMSLLNGYIKMYNCNENLLIVAATDKNLTKVRY